MSGSPPTTSELGELEAVVVDALRDGDHSTLNVIGHGEISVALGWPIDAPRFVCKRTPPLTQAEFRSYQDLVVEYVTTVQQRGLDVVDTKIVPLDRGPEVICYLVQPLLDIRSLGHEILAASEPDPDHPFLTALADSLDVVSPTVSVDAQVTNFAWDGNRLTLVDVGTPLLWDEAGRFRFDMNPHLRALPAPARRLAKREVTKLVDQRSDPKWVAIDIVANLYREGLPQWVDAMVVALNRPLDGTPVTAQAAKEYYREDAKTWPLLKRLQRVERWWQRSIRRRPYDWFIYSGFD